MRGKHGRAAENRTALMVETEARYRRKVAALTREIKDLKALMRDRDSLNAQALKRVRAERDAGVSPALVVAQREALTMREERDAALARARDTARVHHEFLESIVDHFKGVHHLTPQDAVEALMGLRQGAPVLVDWGAMAAKHGLSREAVARIQGARGRRVREIEAALGMGAEGENPPQTT